MKLVFIINKTLDFYFIYFFFIKLIKMLNNQKWLKLRILIKILERDLFFIFSSIFIIYLLNSILSHFFIISESVVKNINVNIIKNKFLIKWLILLFFLILLKFFFDFQGKNLFLLCILFINKYLKSEVYLDQLFLQVFNIRSILFSTRSISLRNFLEKLVLYKKIYANKVNLFQLKLILSYYKINFLYPQFFLLLFKKSIKRLKNVLFIFYKKSSSYSVNWLITNVNSFLLNWFKEWVNKIDIFIINKLEFIQSVDFWIYKKYCYLINRVHSNKSLLWKIQNYFGNFNPYRLDFWTFGDFYSGFYSLKIIWLILS